MTKQELQARLQVIEQESDMGEYGKKLRQLLGDILANMPDEPAAPVDDWAISKWEQEYKPLCERLLAALRSQPQQERYRIEKESGGYVIFEQAWIPVPDMQHLNWFRTREEAQAEADRLNAEAGKEKA